MSESPPAGTQPMTGGDGLGRGPIAGLARWLGRTPPTLLVVHGLLILIFSAIAAAVYSLLYGAALKPISPMEGVQAVEMAGGVRTAAALQGVYLIFTASFYLGIVAVATALARIIAGRRDGPTAS